MPEISDEIFANVAASLVTLYEEPFGGKRRGRYRIPIKLAQRLLGQKRIWPDQIEAVRRALYDRGFVLHDMESYWVVVSQKTFASYRRVNEASLIDVNGPLHQLRDATREDELNEAAE